MEKETLTGFFEDRLGRNVNLTLTDNIRRMISFRDDDDGSIILRLHYMFCSASENILDSVAEFIENPSKPDPCIKKYMHENKDYVRPAKLPEPRKTILRPKGKLYDLDRIFARLNAQYFDSRLEMRITWGRKVSRKKTRSVRMGSYNNHTKVIIISPRLDNANIPLYYLEYVVYHEMVHAVVGTRISPSGRRDVHGRDFKRLERLFDKYKEAIKFESTFPW